MTVLSAPLSSATLDLAVRRLAAGGLVAFPTETVYGLGGDATNDAAVAGIFAAKGRPHFNPLIAHVADHAAAAALVLFEDWAWTLVERFWPGPLTLVLPRRPDSPLSLLVSAGLDSVAVRMPDHPVALALLSAYGRPLAAPSANRSGAVSPTTAAHVAESLGPDAALILDGGPCRVGVESTVLDLTGPRPLLLRPGGLALETLESVLGTPIESATILPGTAPRAPGMLASQSAGTASSRSKSGCAAPRPAPSGRACTSE